jgi:hypothetical protein
MTVYSLEESIHISEETIASIFKVDLSYVDTLQPGDTTTNIWKSLLQPSSRKVQYIPRRHFVPDYTPSHSRRR